LRAWLSTGRPDGAITSSINRCIDVERIS
jgi:hypothetical protein